MKESQNHYILDAELVNFVNAREGKIFTPAQLRDHLKARCGATHTNNFVARWLDVKLKNKEIKRLQAQGYYKAVTELESKLNYIRKCLNAHNVDTPEI